MSVEVDLNRTSTEPQQTSSLSQKCSRSSECALRSTSREASTEPQQTSSMSQKRSRSSECALRTSRETSTEPQQTSNHSKKCSRSGECALRSTSRETSTEPQQTSNHSKKCSNMPSSVPVHIQSKMSQLDDVTFLRVEHTQPVNIVKHVLKL